MQPNHNTSEGWGGLGGGDGASIPNIAFLRPRAPSAATSEAPLKRKPPRPTPASAPTHPPEQLALPRGCTHPPTLNSLSWKVEVKPSNPR